MKSSLQPNNDLFYQRRLHQKDAEIANLQDKVAALSEQLQTALQAGKRRHHPLSPHTVNIQTSGRNKRATVDRRKLGRNASITTRAVLDKLAEPKRPDAVQRILNMFQNPTMNIKYLSSEEFGVDLLKLAKACKSILEREPRVVFLQSPCYVFGDIHGNLEDLHFFSDNIWRLGMSLTAGNFLFLGDYVDRGLNCLECVAYLLAMKYELPNKVFLLRGNHETRDVNGWEEHYAERSFIYQCRSRFGDHHGYQIWEAVNQVFDRIPLAAVIDQDIFCVHGGIPRPVSNTTRIQDILSVSRVAGINPPYEHEDDRYQQVASDCIWSDPASEEQELTIDPDTGYGNSLRGGGAICFGAKAVTNFLQQHNFSYIMRAHEAHAEGVAVSKGARVFTVFSTSKDHNQGDSAMAGCILVDNDKLQVINRSPAYKNQYVHRRDSVSLSTLSESEIEQRIKLGLVTVAKGPAQQEEELEHWEDFDELEVETEDEKKEFVFSQGRRSSVDLASLSENSHDETDLETDSDVTGFGEPHCKRIRSKFSSISSIPEADDEEIDTVDGNEDVELRDV